MSDLHTKCELTGKEKNFLLVKCAWCTKDMELTEGSIILGSEWYHKNCYANMIIVKTIEVKTQYGIKYGD